MNQMMNLMMRGEGVTESSLLDEIYCRRMKLRCRGQYLEFSQVSDNNHSIQDNAPYLQMVTAQQHMAEDSPRGAVFLDESQRE